MIAIEVEKKEVATTAKAEVRNLPGMLFGGTSPLLKPFMKKLEELMPLEKRSRGDNYTLSNLYSYIDWVHADESCIHVRSGDKVVEISRDELSARMEERHPMSEHERLNLAGLLFLQSSPALQASIVSKLKSCHGLGLPEGRRTHRYIFHLIVVSLEADKERIGLEMDPSRLRRNLINPR